MIAVTLMGAISFTGADMGFWEGFYFACFLAGLLLSVISLIGGMGHISWHFHPPHVPGEAHVPHMPNSQATLEGRLRSGRMPLLRRLIWQVGPVTRRASLFSKQLFVMTPVHCSRPSA